MKKLQRGLVVSLLTVVITLLFVGGGIYVYRNVDKGDVNATNQDRITSPNNIGVDSSTSSQVSLKVATTTEIYSKKAETAVNKPITVAVSTKGSPKETYLKMRVDFENVNSFDDILAVALKYQTKVNYDEYMSKKAEVDALPTEFKDSFVIMVKSSLPTLSQVSSANITESIQGDTAILTLMVDGQKGTITMKRENGEWKIESESWKQ